MSTGETVAVEASHSLEPLLEGTRAAPLPRHVGIIMDGNGRWAQARGLPRGEGHRQGALAVERVVRFAAAEKLMEHLTVYAFSTENWSRPEQEVRGLFRLLEAFLRRKEREFVDSGTRLRVLGDLSALPERLREACEHVQLATRDSTRMTLNVALNYGGRWALAKAAEAFGRHALRTGQAELDEVRFARFLPSSGLPDLDLVVRTGGHRRLSNFLLWEAAYAEFLFTSTLWPDYDERALLLSIREFQRRKRNFGRIVE